MRREERFEGDQPGPQPDYLEKTFQRGRFAGAPFASLRTCCERGIDDNMAVFRDRDRWLVAD
jgi:hypothetical protein